MNRKVLSSSIISCLLMAWAPQALASYTQTQHPIILVHGVFGFDEIFGQHYFHQIPQALEKGGAQVFTAQLSALNSNEVRASQLIQQIEYYLAVSGAKKVNLIGHSQGGLAARIVAGRRPDLVASVTTIGTPNDETAFPLGELIRQKLPPDSTPGQIVAIMVTLFAKLINQVSDGGGLPQNYQAFLASVDQSGLRRLNMRYPNGLPDTYCGEGEPVVDGIYYYSWSGNQTRTNPLDVSDQVLHLASQVIEEESDGLITQCGSHLGTVIRDDYPLNHLDQVNLFFGLHGLSSSHPVSLYRSHANRLRNSGL